MAIYDAFISYSHAKDKPVATALQSVVQKLGKPWYRRRALRLSGGIRLPKIATMIVDPTGIQIELHNGQEQSFQISWSKCFANSERPWIVCNHCRQRYARLFRGFAGYSCRACLDLWYACQTISTRKRQRKRLAKISAMIDGQPWRYLEAKRILFPKRPAGMHRARYFRLYDRAVDLQAKLAGP
jgi:hypothetical protein